MRRITPVALLLVSLAADASVVKRATLGKPDQRGFQHGRLQYRHVALGTRQGQRWAEMVVPARDGAGNFVAREVQTSDGRVYTQRAMVKLPDGRRLVEVSTLRVAVDGKAHRSHAYLIDRGGKQTPFSPRNLRQLDFQAVLGYQNLRYVFDAGERAVRPDRPLIRQVAEQLQGR